MKKLLFLAAIVFVSGVGLAGAYVGIGVAADLRSARAALAQGARVDDRGLETARDRLRRADGRLESGPARFLAVVPVASQNLRAVKTAVDALLPAVEAAGRLKAALGDLGEPIVSDGRVNIEQLSGLKEPLQDQADTVAMLERSLQDALSGWLVPPVWAMIDDLAERASEIHTTTENALTGLELARPMLGYGEPRTYLVLLLNNAELRGAGGIMSGIGSLEARRGRLRLGDFYYYNELRDDPPRKVEALPDLARRFGRYRADTTVWVNASASPDVPEVAEVAANLYEVTVGARADGVILVDPRGVAALTPGGTRLKVPGGESVGREGIAQYIYSDSYAEVGGAEAERRRAILTLGRAAFESLIDGESDLESLARSASPQIQGGHLRLVSFHDDERRLLDAFGATGALRAGTVDSNLVTLQNLGADKLDYYLNRELHHSCTIDGSIAYCRTRASFQNSSPRGLPAYVVQEKESYALYKGYAEIYVPAAAAVTGLELDDEPVVYYPEREDDRLSLGFYLELPRGRESTVLVTYEIPVDGSYSLRLDPQPLAHDAHYRVEIDAPVGWEARGDAEQDGGAIRADGVLDRSIEVSIQPPQARGITAAWNRLVRFWREPVF